MAKKAYIGIPEYTELAYIESTGTQYIDTGFKPSSNTRIVVDFENMKDFSSTPASVTPLFGARAEVSLDVFGMWLGLTTYPHFGDVSHTAAGGFSVNINARLTYEMNGNVARIGTETITCGSDTFTTNCNLHLLGMNTNGTIYVHRARGRLYSCQIYDSGTLVRDFVPCQRASGDVGMLDRVNRVFYGNKGTGVFVGGEAVGVLADGVAHKVKKMYIGVGGVARKIKKAYIGDATGVARLFLAQGKVTRKSAKTLSEGRYGLASATVGDNALFAGGYVQRTTSPILGVVDAFNLSLTRTAVTKLSVDRYNLTGVSVGDYALFCGGVKTSGLANTVDVYDKALTLSKPSQAVHTAADNASASVGDHAIIAGGYSSTKTLSTVYAYDSSLTRKSATALTDAVSDLSATRLGGYAIFAGGYYDPHTGEYRYSVYVDAYNASLTKTNLPDLSVGRRDMAAASVGRYALFGGGDTSSSSYTAMVDAFDESFVRTTPTKLRAGKRCLCAETLGDFAIFGGGEFSERTVDLYDTSLTRTTGTSFISEKTNKYASTVIGDYALFGGGDSVDGTKVEVYTLE